MTKYITPEQYDQAARNGIDKARLEYRVRIGGWSVERAIRTPKRPYKVHNTWVAVARKNGLPDYVFYSRLGYGWDAETAAATPVLSRSEVGRLGGKSSRGRIYV